MECAGCVERRRKEEATADELRVEAERRWDWEVEPQGGCGERKERRE